MPLLVYDFLKRFSSSCYNEWFIKNANPVTSERVILEIESYKYPCIYSKFDLYQWQVVEKCDSCLLPIAQYMSDFQLNFLAGLEIPHPTKSLLTALENEIKTRYERAQGTTICSRCYPGVNDLVSRDHIRIALITFLNHEQEVVT